MDSECLVFLTGGRAGGGGGSGCAGMHSAALPRTPPTTRPLELPRRPPARPADQNWVTFAKNQDPPTTVDALMKNPDLVANVRGAVLCCAGLCSLVSRRRRGYHGAAVLACWRSCGGCRATLCLGQPAALAREGRMGDSALLAAAPPTTHHPPLHETTTLRCCATTCWTKSSRCPTGPPTCVRGGGGGRRQGAGPAADRACEAGARHRAARAGCWLPCHPAALSGPSPSPPHPHLPQQGSQYAKTLKSAGGTTLSVRWAPAWAAAWACSCARHSLSGWPLRLVLAPAPAATHPPIPSLSLPPAVG